MDEKYIVEVGGDSWAVGPRFSVQTIREARRKIEEFGDTADYGVISTRSGKVVAKHERNRSTGHWYRAVVV